MRFIGTSVRHVVMALAEASLLALLVVALVAAPAFAGKGGNGGGKGKPGTGSTGSLTLVMVADANRNGAPNWGDTITFQVTSTSQYPYVDVACYQGGTLVYSAYAGFYPSYPWPGAQQMPLYSPSWTGGAAGCVAKLNSVTALSFAVGA